MKNNKKIKIYGLTLITIVVIFLFLNHSPKILSQMQTPNNVSSTVDSNLASTTDDYDTLIYGTATSTVLGMSDTDSNILLESDNVVPTYKDFLNNDLQKTCPFYKPAGVTYRDCLTNLLEVREKGAEQVYSEIVRDAKIVNDEVMAEDPVNGNLTTEVTSGFLKSLVILHKTWKPYRDALCETEMSGTRGGSNEDGYIDTCRLYETTVYETRLLGFRYDWIGYDVEWRVKQNAVIKLDIFKKLIQREQQMFGSIKL